MAERTRKSFITGLLVGLLIGCILTATGLILFGDQLRSNVADATEELGEGVQRVGKDLEKTGEKMR